MTENARHPAAQLEARANREHAKLAKASHELNMLVGVIRHCELPTEIKLRLYGALKRENDLIEADKARIQGLREAAKVSRGPSWVTSGDE